MSTDDDLDPDGDISDDSVRLLLAWTEPSPPATGHVDLNTLAVLAEGGLDSGELEEVWAHVSACPPCRRLVSATLNDAARLGGEPPGTPEGRLVTST